MGEKTVTSVGETYSPPITQEKARANNPLKLCNASGKTGLGNTHPLGCTGKIACIDYGKELAKLSAFYHSFCLSYFSPTINFALIG
jgi:hypothetical protein